MLDKYKARKQKIGQAIEDFEATHDNVRKTHKHLSKHRGKYCLVTGVVVGVGATIVLQSRGINAPAISMSVSHEATNTIGDVTDSIVAIDQSLTIHQQFGGYCCKIVQDLDNPERLVMKINAVAKELAEENNVPFETARQLLSKHLNGHTNHAYGRHFRIAGVTTVPA